MRVCACVRSHSWKTTMIEYEYLNTTNQTWKDDTLPMIITGIIEHAVLEPNLNSVLDSQAEWTQFEHPLFSLLPLRLSPNWLYFECTAQCHLAFESLFSVFSVHKWVGEMRNPTIVNQNCNWWLETCGTAVLQRLCVCLICSSFFGWALGSCVAKSR